MASKKNRAAKVGGAKGRKQPTRRVKVVEMRAAARTSKEKAQRAREMKAFGAKLRAARLRAGLSQKQLAGLTRVTQPHICNVERGLPSGLAFEKRALAACAAVHKLNTRKPGGRGKPRAAKAAA